MMVTIVTITSRFYNTSLFISPIGAHHIIPRYGIF
ncbi:MAG: hypothetical protein Solumvirus2_33 [Solumvirus sp.]|uniref:Uncharacterized protein n=1 Tax=Solumvirus sp. TaxID=2487773 RepID=A0A3G5AG76_9VIRU|nr:MAG: hypothetical protein Solumvirus2_33 [Solumvirus sp.]